MYPKTQPLLFLLHCLFGIDRYVSAARIPLQPSPIVRNVLSTVEVPGLDFFTGYVCPDTANEKRNIVSVPIDELENILLKLQDMELEILILIGQFNNLGQLDSTDASGVFVGENGEDAVYISSPSSSVIDCSSPSSAVESIASAEVLVSSDLVASSTAVLQTSFESGAIAIATSKSQSTNLASAAVSIHTLTNVAASSTTTPDSESAETSIYLAEPPTTLIDEGASSTTEEASVAAISTAIASVLVSSDNLSDTAASSTLAFGFDPSASSSSEAAASTSTGGVFVQISSTTSSYTFDSQSTKNVAVYFGQTAATGGTSLALQCASPNIDIVILAFVISSSSGGIYPSVNFGAACGGQTSEMVSKAPGLLSCPQLASDITTCQTEYGKKVLLSIGGATSQISFASGTEASAFATMLWNLFGPSGSVDVGLRPFGTVEIDGFDVDNEDNLPANWATFASTMRGHYTSITTKSYYLSSAPQCPFPDASNPQDLLVLCDFVWVQFYNNPSCQIGSTGFNDSMKQWSTALLKSTLGVKPKLYLGAPAFSAAGSSAYTAIGNAQGMQAIAKSAEHLGLSNFGGVMFWDGPEGMLNTYGGNDILAWAKLGLSS